MSFAIVAKLLAILAAVGLGWAAGRFRLLGEGDPARVLANAAFYLFVPALLVRTTARLDTSALPWSLLAAFFVPVLGLIALVYLWQRPRRRSAAEPSVKAITAGFGNTLQVGIPLAAGVFGETGLAIHITVVSLHALVLLIMLTLLVELDLAREQGSSSLAATLLQTARNTVIHPVVLPVVVGLAWNVTGWPLPAVLDEALQTLGTAVVPLCLTLIGLSLAQYGWRGSLPGCGMGARWPALGWPARRKAQPGSTPGEHLQHRRTPQCGPTQGAGAICPAIRRCSDLAGGDPAAVEAPCLAGQLAPARTHPTARQAPWAWRGMLGLVLVKLMLQPALVLVCAHWGFGLSGLPLAVIVMMGALPIGSNALIFAQRYRALEAETTAATVLSTVAYVATAPLWLALLARYFPWGPGA